jgi:hypothetical protein
VWLDWCAVSGGEHQSGLKPGVVRIVLILITLLQAELQAVVTIDAAAVCCLRFRFGLLMQQLPACPLQLLRDDQFRSIEVDIVTGQSEHFALT